MKTAILFVAYLAFAPMCRADEPSSEAEPAPPYEPQPAHPLPSTAGKSLGEWYHLTDDWAGARYDLDHRGILIRSGLTLDSWSNLKGGADTEKHGTLGLFTISLTLDLQKLADLHGAQLFVNFLHAGGAPPNESVGGAQNVDNIDPVNSPRSQLSEAWYQQNILNNALQFKVGKMNANNDFDYANNSSEFINSSFGNSPTIFDFPSYPDNRPGANVFYLRKIGPYAGLGIYEGPRLHDPFVIGEIGARWAGEYSGRAGAGVWRHTDEADAEGFYFAGDQTIHGGISGFVMYGYGNPAASQFEHHLGGGLIWKGALPQRRDDLLGLGFTYVVFGDSPRAQSREDAETTIELFYKIQLTRFIIVQPDLQYVHDPGGIRSRPDAIVAILRMTVDF